MFRTERQAVRLLCIYSLPTRYRLIIRRGNRQQTAGGVVFITFNSRIESFHQLFFFLSKYILLSPSFVTRLRDRVILEKPILIFFLPTVAKKPTEKETKTMRCDKLSSFNLYIYI